MSELDHTKGGNVILSVHTSCLATAVRGIVLRSSLRKAGHGSQLESGVGAKAGRGCSQHIIPWALQSSRRGLQYSGAYRSQTGDAKV